MTTSEWDWSTLSQTELDRRWQTLAGWVSWLQDNYTPWVKLPPCWARHEALRAELEFFRAWHTQLLEDGDATEGTSWHSSLRSAASAWMAVADCEHDSQFTRRSGRGDTDQVRRHLQEAMRERPASRR
jgi:hypothetical protein